jgi:hypothetical protein
MFGWKNDITFLLNIFFSSFKALFFYWIDFATPFKFRIINFMFSSVSWLPKIPDILLPLNFFAVFQLMFNIYKIIRSTPMLLHLVVVILLIIIFFFLIIFLILMDILINWRLVSKINLITIGLFLNLHLFFWLFSY